MVDTQKPEPVAVEQGDETILGLVQCHCTEDDGVPDVGLTIGLGEGSSLWIGELLDADGGDIGVVFHGPSGERIASPMWPTCEWQEIAGILRNSVAPILARHRLAERARLTTDRSVGAWRDVVQPAANRTPLKGFCRSPKYYPAIGETCRMSGPNCDDADGYTWGEVEVLWRDDLFIVTRTRNCWPTVTKLELALFEPANDAALSPPITERGVREACPTCRDTSPLPECPDCGNPHRAATPPVPAISDDARSAFYAESTVANDVLPGTQVVAIDGFLRAVGRLAVPAISGEKLALQAIKAVCATTKDAVKGLSRILSITRQAGVAEPYSELLKDRRVEMIVQLPRTEWQHLFERPTACEVPPSGWFCSRGAGHDGPCAATPTISGEGEKLREFLRALEFSLDGYSLRIKYDGDVDGDGRHIVVGGETVATFADSNAGDEFREAILAFALATPDAAPIDKPPCWACNDTSPLPECPACGNPHADAAPIGSDDAGEVDAEVQRILAMSDDEIMAEANVSDVAWARAFKQGLALGKSVHAKVSQ